MSDWMILVSASIPSVMCTGQNRSVSNRTHVPYLSSPKEVGGVIPWFSGLFDPGFSTYLEVYLQNDEAECNALNEVL